MKINSVAGVIFQVKDISASTNFYQSLGFRIDKKIDGQVDCYLNWFWIRLAPKTSSDSLTLPTPTTPLYLKVDDINIAYQEVVGHGLAPAHPPIQNPDKTKQFDLLDPDGHRLVFFAKK